jgi:hypothetical protein
MACRTNLAGIFDEDISLRVVMNISIGEVTRASKLLGDAPQANLHATHLTLL